MIGPDGWTDMRDMSLLKKNKQKIVRWSKIKERKKWLGKEYGKNVFLLKENIEQILSGELW